MSMSPEQMRALYAQMGQWGVLTPEQIQRQRMEQQWAAAQGAYSNVPGAPAAPNAQYDVWRQAATPAASGDEQMNYAQDMVTMPDGRVLPRQQALQQGYQQAQKQFPAQAPAPAVGQDMRYVPPTQPAPNNWIPGDPGRPPWAGGAQQPIQGQPSIGIEPWNPAPNPALKQQPGATPAAPQESIDMGMGGRIGIEPWNQARSRQRMEERFMATQGAYGKPGGPWRGGLIDQLNAKQDPYAGQNLNAEQRQVATANDQAARAYQQKQAPAPAPAPGQVPSTDFSANGAQRQMEDETQRMMKEQQKMQSQKLV